MHIPNVVKTLIEYFAISKKFVSLQNEKRKVMSTSDIKLLLSGYFKDKPVNKVWLFGSYARGEENADSDIDLMIDLDHSQPVGLKFFGMWNDLESLLGRDVDLVTEEGLADYARESYNRDKILIYERNC